jgi:hypothetical protein
MDRHSVRLFILVCAKAIPRPSPCGSGVTQTAPRVAAVNASRARIRQMPQSKSQRVDARGRREFVHERFNRKGIAGHGETAE